MARLGREGWALAGGGPPAAGGAAGEDDVEVRISLPRDGDGIGERV